MTGTVFDIQEFAVNDGPGIRVTVFMKGCPLRCKWCHNPEGIGFKPQKNLVAGNIIGQEWGIEELFERLISLKSAYDISHGGVTFSGGEPTAQFDFVYALAHRLKEAGVHINLDTCGYCDEIRFKKLIEVVDLVYFDIKCVDGEIHREMTGVDNDLIIRNLRNLASASVAYRIRVPLTKDVSDTVENRQAMELLVGQLQHKPDGVDWLPFNQLAAAKYKNVGMEYKFNG